MRIRSVLCVLIVAGILPVSAISCTNSSSPNPSEQPKAAAPAAKASVSGSWSWSVDAGGMAIDQSAVLKQEGEKITGKFTDGFDNTTVDIKEGKIRDGQVSFTVVRPFMDNGDMTLKFEGKLDGDTIKGTLTLTMADQPSNSEWTAKRGS